MKRVKSISLILFVCSIILLMVACNGSKSNESETDKKDTPVTEKEETELKHGREPLKVAVSVLDIGNTLYSDIVGGVKSALDESYDTITIVDCQNNPAKQAEQIESLVNAAYDGIIMLPQDAAALSPITKEAMDNGTKIITYVTKLEEQDAHISSNPFTYGYMLGEYAGEWIAEHWPDEEEVKVGMLTYNSIPEVITRQEGMAQGLKDKAPNAVIVAEKDAAAPEDGMAVAETFLQAHPDMKAIMGINDGGAVGAHQAVVAANLDNPHFFVGGTDGIPQAFELIRDPNSFYRCTVWIDPFNIGKSCAENLINMKTGKEVWTEKEYNLKLLTNENINDFIK